MITSHEFYGGELFALFITIKTCVLIRDNDECSTMIKDHRSYSMNNKVNWCITGRKDVYLLQVYDDKILLLHVEEFQRSKLPKDFDWLL